MDYQGNYFPEEQDENESKTYRVVKGIFKWTLYGISFVIYGIVLFLMFINRDSKILEKNYMGELAVFEGVDTDDLELYRINTRIFMNDDGSLQLHNVDYSDEYNVIELGIKFNAKKLTDEKYTDSLDYVLEDSNGNNYKMVNIVTDSGGRYGYARVCFEGPKINLDSNDLRFNNRLYGSAKPAFFIADTEIIRDKTKFTLSVYRKSDNELIYKFDLYDTSTTFNHTDYND